MKRIVAVTAVALALAAGTEALAQTAPAPSPHQHGPAPGGSPAPAQPSHRPMMGQGSKDMMCPMMGQQPMGGTGAGHGMGMGPGMMGTMMGGGDPKAQARMLRLRGDMMKAMGDVMLKHAQELEQQK